MGACCRLPDGGNWWVGLCLWVKLEVAVCLGVLSAACLLMGGAVIPPGLLFGLGLLRADGWGRIFSKWLPPEKGTLLNIPKSFASSVLPSQKAKFTLFSQDVLQELQSGLTQIPMETLLCPGTQCT